MLNPNTILFSEFRSLPNVTAVYRVSDSAGKVLYVGQATNLRERWRGQHSVKDLVIAKGLDASLLKLSWLVCPKYLLNRVECCAIDFFKPEFNIQPGRSF